MSTRHGRSVEIEAQPRKKADTRRLLLSTHPDDVFTSEGLTVSMVTKIPGTYKRHNQLWLTNAAAQELMEFLAEHLVQEARR